MSFESPRALEASRADHSKIEHSSQRPDDTEHEEGKRGDPVPLASASHRLESECKTREAYGERDEHERRIEPWRSCKRRAYSNQRGSYQIRSQDGRGDIYRCPHSCNGSHHRPKKAHREHRIDEGHPAAAMQRSSFRCVQRNVSGDEANGASEDMNDV